MRVLQLIDSLRPGGAERMAVNIANALVPNIEKSYLCCTRLEGSLLKHLSSDVTYIFLNKKSRFDFKAIISFKKIITENKIDIVHAHGTSFFLPALLRFGKINFNLVWHVHNGGIKNSPFIDQKITKFFSLKFDGIIAVNSELKKWSQDKLFCQEVIASKNFISKGRWGSNKKFKFKGNKESFKIICLANIRPEKGHLYLIEAFETLEPTTSCSLHLVGSVPANFETTEIFKRYKKSKARDKIHFYGVKENITEILEGGDLGILASDYEGLPVALLEYGMAGLPVIVTDVGQCRELIGEHGIVVKPQDPVALNEAIGIYLLNPEKRMRDSAKFHNYIINNYSEKEVLPSILKFYIKLSDPNLDL